MKMETSRRGLFGLLAGALAAPYVPAVAPAAPMVVPASDAYTQIGMREDLSDIIYSISPQETPFLSMMRRSSPSPRMIAWQKDALIGR